MQNDAYERNFFRTPRMSAEDVEEITSLENQRLMMAELDAIEKSLGIATMPDAGDTSERTRYAKPGQRVGTGYVRKLSEKQVRFIKALLATRNTRNLVRLPGSEDIENMSLAGARDLIDRLLACPELPKAKSSSPRPASDKQLYWLRKLADEKDVPADLQSIVDDAVAERFVSLKDASAALDVLFHAPRKTLTRETVEIKDGMYRKGSSVYKVQFNRSHTALYAKKLTGVSEYGKPEWEYAGSVYKLKLTPSDKMTLEDAKKFGALYGTCLSCGRTLTDETSIENAIGPVCAKKFS